MPSPFSPTAAHWRTPESHKGLIGIAKSLILQLRQQSSVSIRVLCSALRNVWALLPDRITSNSQSVFFWGVFFVKLDVREHKSEICRSCGKPRLPLQVPEHLNKAFLFRRQKRTAWPMPEVLCRRYGKNRLWEQVGTSCCQRRGAARSGEILQDAALTPTYGVSRLQMM